MRATSLRLLKPASSAVRHGGSVRKSVWDTTSFYPRVPQFGFDPLKRTDSQIFEIVKHGIRYTVQHPEATRKIVRSEIWQVLHQTDPTTSGGK